MPIIVKLAKKYDLELFGVDKSLASLGKGGSLLDLLGAAVKFFRTGHEGKCLSTT